MHGAGWSGWILKRSRIGRGGLRADLGLNQRNAGGRRRPAFARGATDVFHKTDRLGWVEVRPRWRQRWGTPLMGFKTGRLTFMRYQVTGDSPLPFGTEQLDRLESKRAGQIPPSTTKEGISHGWAGGDHVLDLNFDLAKNVLGDALHAAVRIDTDKIPGSLLRAYTKMETDTRAKANPSGFPTKAQRQEAKEAALARAEAEAADGRFRRLKQFEILWDGTTNTLYAGSTSAAALDRLHVLFKDTFDRTLQAVTAGSLAVQLAERRGQTEAIGNLRPVGFLGETAGYDMVAWTGGDPAGLDYQGNEFLIWLWHTLQTEGDTLSLADGSEVAVMMTKTLVLDCPRGETGRDALTDEGPTRMPEAFRALQAGKLPRKAGLALIRHGVQYDLTLQAETFAVSGLTLPKPEGLSGHDAHLARVESLRHAMETLDLLYDLYGRTRLEQDSWNNTIDKIRSWLTAA